MIVSTVIAATVAAANPQAAEPVKDAHAGHQAMQHGDKTMACCEEMAKGDGCSCCKGKDDKAHSGAAQGHEGHAGHTQ